jgi:type 1 fimbria pilin
MHNNIKAKSLYAALGMAFATTAWAEAPTQDMTVAGTIKAPTCEVDIGGGEGGGTINHGDISPTLINAGATFHQLPTVTLDWTISCDAQTYLIYQVVDNEAESANKRGNDASYPFGLGWINVSDDGKSAGKLGYYLMETKGMTVDGATAYHGATSTSDPSSGWTVLDTRTAYSFQYVRNTPGWRFGWGESHAQYSPLKAGKDFTMKLEVRTFLSGAADMNGGVTDTVPLQGHTTFSFAFAL